MGYVAAYFSDVYVQKIKQEHSFIIQLLRDDPRESSDNLLRVHNAEFIKLTPKTVEKLGNEIFSAPTVAENIHERVATDSFDAVQNTNHLSLVSALDAPDRSDRWKALEQLELRGTQTI